MKNHCEEIYRQIKNSIGTSGISYFSFPIMNGSYWEGPVRWQLTSVEIACTPYSEKDGYTIKPLYSLCLYLSDVVKVSSIAGAVLLDLGDGNVARLEE